MIGTGAYSTNPQPHKKLRELVDVEQQPATVERTTGGGHGSSGINEQRQAQGCLLRGTDALTKMSDMYSTTFRSQNWTQHTL
ncbi:hypothetical protein [Streptomyces glomeratus]|uniref:Uncharacterized protein n=1 Tax=Streptomyces glomeratus TaxID=284452 RepID=A0ABP6M335_9ACTN|nr:hypothetical protein [Streptomyces glomeratus]MCF1512561.1 hypothetical protein [Streptomyces glomeratus]